jgi:hypothetical protein
MNKQTIITIFLALLALTATAQEIKMNEASINDYLPLLKAKGYFVYSFDTKDFKDALVTPVIMEYVKGEEPRDALGFDWTVSMGEKLLIGFAPSDNDSTVVFTIQITESIHMDSRLLLKPIDVPGKPEKHDYKYEPRPFKLEAPFEKGKFIPLVLYGSYWYEAETGAYRFCGDSSIKSDLSSDILKETPHFYVLGIKIK